MRVNRDPCKLIPDLFSSIRANPIVKGGEFFEWRIYLLNITGLLCHFKDPIGWLMTCPRC